MAIKAIEKGKNGEREVATKIRELLDQVITEMGYQPPGADKLLEIVERNTQQSSIGGCDIVFMGLAIEVKRQETLDVKNWWKQTLRSANTLNAIPILLYRKNRKPWTAKMETIVPLGNGNGIRLAAELEEKEFFSWLRSYMTRGIREGLLENHLLQT